MMPRFSLIVPTRNRIKTLTENLQRLTALAETVPGGAEIIVADNGSDDGTPELVRSRFSQVRLIELEENRSTAARNVAAEHAAAPFLVMLDDDSYLDSASLALMGRALEADDELACVAARVERAHPPGSHEGGGLPGVFIGCGAAIRGEVFAAVGGYPDDYGYYVEEYDFCFRMLQRGRRVRWFEDIVVCHERSDENRDFNRIVRFLTRNNLRLWERYAPPGMRDAMLAETVERYARIARRERAEVGYFQGIAEAAELLGAMDRAQPGPPDAADVRRLTRREFDIVYGLDDARRVVEERGVAPSYKRPAVYARGKGVEQLLDVCEDLGLRIETLFDPHYVEQTQADYREHWRGRLVVPPAAADRYRPDVLIVGSLSPGACRDLAREARRAFPSTAIVEPVVWAKAARSTSTLCVGA
ncbi:MAG: glycosyltransferase [Phycisphaerales bacterium]|nr:MAG: glycosyltransferase [Phycisphaerales bacterium]